MNGMALIGLSSGLLISTIMVAAQPAQAGLYGYDAYASQQRQRDCLSNAIGSPPLPARESSHLETQPARLMNRKLLSGPAAVAEAQK